MSDEKLRELERRWKESGSVEDESAWLRERVRVGDLAPSKLQLVAELGDPAAQHALGHASVGLAGEEFNGLASWEKEFMIRAGVAALWVGLSVWEVYREDDGLQRLLTLACEWVVSPSPELATEVLRAARAVGGASGMGSLDEVLDEVLREEFEGQGFQRVRRLIDGAESLADAVYRPGQHACAAPTLEAIAAAADATTQVAVGNAIRRELRSWALGGRDPIRERVEARLKEKR